MSSRILILCAVVLSLSACSTRLNPMNWFGNDREERVETVEVVTESDLRPLVPEIVSLNVDAMPGGAIVRAVGLPPMQGYWEADLVEVGREDGTLTFEFRIFPPLTQTRVSTQRSREILAGTSLSLQDLQGVRTIVVIGQQNRRSVRR